MMQFLKWMPFNQIAELSVEVKCDFFQVKKKWLILIVNICQSCFLWSGSDTNKLGCFLPSYSRVKDEIFFSLCCSTKKFHLITFDFFKVLFEIFNYNLICNYGKLTLVSCCKKEKNLVYDVNSVKGDGDYGVVNGLGCQISIERWLV